MKKPEEIEINTQAINAFKESIYSNNNALRFVFCEAFDKGLHWLLNWQKTQPLTVYLVIDSSIGIVAVFRTEEGANKGIEGLKSNLPKGEFYVKARII